ncbi:DUF6949 family protein [Pelagibacterium montanilacus]|uniref:DUF6949 family protein n=1 Tax=Pelagibacterium montanilacus TaxID=2185280 RepID=UPI000F8F21B9|nr:hypothetical protein [Pelagibacterium montanilacus]
MHDLVLSMFIIGVGLCVAGMGTHLYQGVARQTAVFRWHGETGIEAVLNLFVSFVCGPYLMLRLGFSSDESNRISTTSALLASFIAFGWSFFTGLMILGTYVGIMRAIA